MLYFIYWYGLAGLGFMFSLAASYALVKRLPSEIINSAENFFSNSVFLSETSVEGNRIAIIRILFGLVVLIRQFFVGYYMLDSELLGIEGLVLLLSIVATILISIGLFTQYALLF